MEKTPKPDRSTDCASNLHAHDTGGQKKNIPAIKPRWDALELVLWAPTWGPRCVGRKPPPSVNLQNFATLDVRNWELVVGVVPGCVNARTQKESSALEGAFQMKTSQTSGQRQHDVIRNFRVTQANHWDDVCPACPICCGSVSGNLAISHISLVTGGVQEVFETLPDSCVMLNCKIETQRGVHNSKQIVGT